MTLTNRRRALVGALRKTPILPAEYQQVEWIQVSGSAYQRLPVAPSLAMKIELDVAHSGNGNVMICSRFQSGTIWRITKHQTLSQNKYSFRCLYSGADVKTDITTNDRVTVILDAPNDLFKASDSAVSVPTSSNTAPQERPYLGSTITTGGSPTVKIWGAKQYNSNVLVADCVPCYRKVDNAIGLYDLVSKTFEGANGENVTKGEDV